jgi:hypothetical protein
LTQFQALKEAILASGAIEDAGVEVLRRALRPDNPMDRGTVEWLLALRKEVPSVCPAFEGLLFQAVRSHVLKDGGITAEEARWLRQILFADGKIDDAGRTILRDLKREARRISPEFQLLYGECMN